MPKAVRASVMLKHIARGTELSIMTVSRVVRDRPDVSPASRRKVLAAQFLASRTTPGARDERIIGTILSPEVVTSHSYFAGIIQGIADEVRRFD
jgi:DNA-binding LacI/PurR family transcriptional regulator